MKSIQSTRLTDAIQIFLAIVLFLLAILQPLELISSFYLNLIFAIDFLIFVPLYFLTYKKGRIIKLGTVTFIIIMAAITYLLIRYCVSFFNNEREILPTLARICVVSFFYTFAILEYLKYKVSQKKTKENK